MQVDVSTRVSKCTLHAIDYLEFRYMNDLLSKVELAKTLGKAFSAVFSAQITELPLSLQAFPHYVKMHTSEDFQMKHFAAVVFLVLIQ